MKKQKITNRIGAGLLAVLFAGLVCIGCTADKADVAETSVEKTAFMICLETGIKMASEASLEEQVEYEPCILRFSFWGDDAKKQEMQQSIDSFESAYPGIVIEVVDGSVEGWEESLVQQLMNANAPDVNQIEWEWIHEYSADGALFYDLYKEHEVLELGAVGQKYLNMCTIAEELQAVPASFSGRVFFFDEQLFEKVGMEVPDTLEELMAAGEIFRTQLGEEYYPLALTTEDRMELLVYYLESVCGKEWIVDGVLQYYVEEVQKGMEFLLSLEEAHVIPTLQYARSEDSLGRDAGWSSGVYGGVFVNSSKEGQYAGMLPAGYECVAAPRFYDMGNTAGGYIAVEEAYAVAENCANKKEAALFLDFLLNQDAEKNTEAVYGADEIALEAAFALNGDYAALMQDDSVYGDVMVGLSYGDYNAREAAQLLLDCLGNIF